MPKIKGKSIMFWLAVILVFCLALIILFPVFWMVRGSLLTRAEIRNIPPELIPTDLTLDNFYNLLRPGRPTWRWLFNSVFTSSLGAFFVVFTSSTAGYAFGKKDFPGRKILFWIIIASMTIPRMVLVIPLFDMMIGLGWQNSYQAVFGPYITWPFGVFLMKQFMPSVPDELIDSAKIDGASEITIFSKIVLPIVKPAVGAVAIFSFVLIWNQYLWHLVILERQEFLTLPLGVAQLVSTYGDYDIGLALAGATFAFIPMMIVFLAFQRYFLKGITIGAVKG